jgi:ActD protein
VKRGLAAEYPSEHALLAAIRAVRGEGLTRLEAYSPVPSEHIDQALGARRSPLAVAAGLGALFGAVGAYFLQWYLVAHLYPVDVGGRPPHMPLPFVIITIEMGFLFGGLFVTFAFIIASRLGKLWEPIFEVPGFESASRAGFWLAIDAEDPTWEGCDVTDVVRRTDPVQLHGFGGVG